MAEQSGAARPGRAEIKEEPGNSPAWRRPAAPLVPVALFLAAGIVVDRYLLPLPTRLWLCALAVAWALGVWSLIRNNRARAGIMLWHGFLALGAGWHHARWFDLPQGDLARFDWSKPAPAWLRGVVAEGPIFRPPDLASGQPEGLTEFTLAVRELNDGQHWSPAGGRVRVLVSAERTEVRMGEWVCVAGKLGFLRGPRNPGEADFRDRWRAQGIRLQLTAQSSEGLLIEPHFPRDPLLSWLGDLRRSSHALLVARLPTDIAPLASALLLGRRESLERGVREAFLLTGTTHWLAISGAHMQVLAIAVGWFLLLLGVGRGTASFLVIVTTALYATLVGLEPSVVRSAAMTVVVCVGVLGNRPVKAENVLALAALVLLALNPASLFDVGAQLSFVSVAALIWAIPWLHGEFGKVLGIEATGPETPRAALDRLERELETGLRKQLRVIGQLLRVGLVSSTVVWLLALPLSLFRFHLVSWVAIPLNLPLVPLSAPALVSGLLVLVCSACGLLWPADLASQCCAWVLRIVEWLVVGAGSIPGGHLFLGGPPGWWVVGVYVLIAWMAWQGVHRTGLRAQRRAWISMCAWIVLGGAWALAPHRPDTLQAEVLAVDHGLAVLVRSPSGHTLLYDCGRMRDQSVGRWTIAPALWARRARQIDTLVISHEDSDHFSGFFDLSERFSIGEVRVPPGFGSGADTLARRILERCAELRVRVIPIVRGESIDLGPGIICRAWHPGLGELEGTSDNARSVVLEISADGRGMLLTGDLEQEGLASILTRPAPAIDVLLSPHHGSRAANPPELFEWADPKCVIVSQAEPRPGAPAIPDQSVVGARRIDRTFEAGAVRLEWRANGIEISNYLKEPDRTRGEIDSRFHLFAQPLGQLAQAWLMVPDWLTGTLSFLAGALACLILAVTEWGAWALVAPGRWSSAQSSETQHDSQRVQIHAQDGTLLVGSWRPSGTNRRKVCVVLHGFAEDASAMTARAALLCTHGWSVLTPDLRARGRSGGEFCTFGALEASDLRCWLDFMQQQVGQLDGLVVWGRSMGAVIALRAAAEDTRIGALILEAPYVELRSAIAAGLRRNRLPGWLAGPILRRARKIIGRALDRPAPPELAARVAIPTLLVAGCDDAVAPPRDIDRLARCFPVPPTRINLAGAGHQNILDVGGASLVDGITNFLDRAGAA